MKKIFAFIVFVFSFVSVFSQTGNDTTKYTYYKNTYGERFRRGRFDTVLMTPNDTTYSKYGLAIKSGALYWGDGSIWRQASGGTGLTNPMTSIGDIIVGGAAGTPTRIGIGSVGQLPHVAGGTLSYFTPGSGDVITWLGYTPGQIGGSATQIPYISAANTLAGDNQFLYDVTNHAVRIGANATGTKKAIYLKWFGASNGSLIFSDTIPLSLSGNANVFFGPGIAPGATTASFNTAEGYGALAACTTCGFNVAIGYNALVNCTDCGSNFVLGNSIPQIVHGQHNITLGGGMSGDFSNTIAIAGIATANNMAVFGDSINGVILGGPGVHTANKPTAFNGRIYYNLDSAAYFWYNGSVEVKFGGSGTGSGTGNPNTHAGAGYWIDNGANNVLKTFAGSYALGLDSLTSNVITWRIDTALIHSTLYNNNRYYLNTNPANYMTASSTNTLTNKSGNISQWTNDAGYLTTLSLPNLYAAGNLHFAPGDSVLRFGAVNSSTFPDTALTYLNFDATHKLKFSIGSDAGWDLFTRDSATGVIARIPKGTVGQFLHMASAGGYDWATPAGGGGGTPGGATTNVQINDAGVFFGEAAFAYDKTSNLLTVDSILSKEQRIVNTTDTTAFRVSVTNSNYAGIELKQFNTGSHARMRILNASDEGMSMYAMNHGTGAFVMRALGEDLVIMTDSLKSLFMEIGPPGHGPNYFFTADSLKRLVIGNGADGTKFDYGIVMLGTTYHRDSFYIGNEGHNYANIYAGYFHTTRTYSQGTGIRLFGMTVSGLLEMSRWDSTGQYTNPFYAGTGTRPLQVTSTGIFQAGSGGTPWSLTGNTAGVNSTLGTLDNFDVIFDVNSTQAGRIFKTTGNWEIGTNGGDPGVKLHITGALSVSSTINAGGNVSFCNTCGLVTAANANSMQILTGNNNAVGLNIATLNAYATGIAATQVKFATSFTLSSNTTETMNLLGILPTLNNTSVSGTHTINGILIDPTNTSLTNTVFNAINVVSGNVKLNTTSGTFMQGTGTDDGTGAGAQFSNAVSFKHPTSKGTAPTTTGLGTNVTSATVVAGSNDHITIVDVVTSGAVSGTVFTLTYNAAWAATPNGVIVQCVSNTVDQDCHPLGGAGVSTTAANIVGHIATGAGTYRYMISTTQ